MFVYEFDEDFSIENDRIVTASEVIAQNFNIEVTTDVSKMKE